ncbi:nucleoside hydrolase [Falsibacillus pallidus]|uniref:nucleoside hydrolase n=1 Tax=Falsibacillus pallidus TaxID=493781 RepID=UPI003D957601
MPKKILLFCDPGIDDSIAIMFALINPEIEIVGIVASYGNVSKEQAIANASYLLDLAGKPEIPVIPGAFMPIQKKMVTYYPEIHGEDGIGPIQPPVKDYIKVFPFDTIRLLIETYGSELNIVDTGRSTSLATAFILYPSQMKLVNGFYLMGGSFFAPGNVTPLAEANFHGDPTSTNFVLKHAHNITITPLNTTNFAYLTDEVVDLFSKHKSNPFAFMLKPIFEYYFTAYKKLSPGIIGAPMHDLVTVMTVCKPNIAEYIYYDAQVIEGIEAKGLSYIDLRPLGKPGKTRIAIKLNYDIFIKELKDCMLKMV